MKPFRHHFAAALIALPLSLLAQTAPPNPAPPRDSSQQIADRIIASKIPVLVDFWAVWCGPCRMLNPTIKEIKEQYHGKIEVIKVNVDVHRALSAYFGISGIPAVFLIKDRTVVKALTGLRQKADYVQAIEEVLKMPPIPPPAAAKDST